jgi:4-amino-4-deoxy-L-arabinose transferase-like glycosyltransferase
MRSISKPSSGFLVTLAVMGALLHGLLGLTATADKSTTADEIGHLTAGLAYNTRGDFRLQPENGNLSQRWVALPMTIANTLLPPTSTPSWQKADVWRYGHAFFYEQGLSTDQFLFLGRMMVALISAGTGLLIFFWSRALFGWRGAFLSLALFVFCPAFLAHGALATSDVMMTFFFLASTGAWWRHLRHPGPGGSLLSALVFGMAFVAKYSALLLLPMLGAIALIWVINEARHGGWRPPLLRLIRTALLHAAIAWILIWMFYGFRFSAFAPTLAQGADFNHSWSWMLEGLGTPGTIIAWCRNHKILPEAWLYGLAFVLGFSEQRAAFLDGHYSLTGWAGFFPFAFLVKTTLPFLGILAIGLIASTRKSFGALKAPVVWQRLLPLVPLAALFTIYWVTSLTSHLNIGDRHILPTYPVLFIGAGWLGRWLDVQRPANATLIALLVAWHAATAMQIRPHYLAYFNEIVGGPRNGWKHLVDSSLDWGQDLPGLSRWLQQNNFERAPAYLSYFGTGDPAYEGIFAAPLPSVPDFGGDHSWRPLTSGIYCVSATTLQQVYSDLHPWTAALEKEFQELRAFEPTFLAFQNDSARRAKLLEDFPASRWRELWKRYEALRFARLCPYLQVRGPDANVGYSILIFRLSAAEVSAATAGSLADWQALIEQRTASRKR